MGESCLRRLAVERYSAGELTGADAAGLEEHLRSCPSCSAYLVTVEKKREEFLRVHPYREFRAAAFPEQAAGPWYKRFTAVLTYPIFRPVLVPALCVLLVAVIAVPYVAKLSTQRESGIRYKGAPDKGAATLSYIYKRGGVVHTGASGELFRGGDQVQVLYTSDKEQYLSLFSIDANGAVSFYQPDTSAGVCSIRCGAGSALAYPCGIELDSAGGAELVVAVFSDGTFDTDQIKKWVAGIKVKSGDMNALETAIKNNPPAAKSSVQTMMLKKR